MFVVLLERA